MLANGVLVCASIACEDSCSSQAAGQARHESNSTPVSDMISPWSHDQRGKSVCLSQQLVCGVCCVWKSTALYCVVLLMCADATCLLNKRAVQAMCGISNDWADRTGIHA